MRSFWARNRPHPSDICRDTELSYHVLYMCRHVSVHSTHNDIFCWYFEVENGNYDEHSDKIHHTWTLSNVHWRMSIISNNLLQWGAMLISLADYDASNDRAQDCYYVSIKNSHWSVSSKDPSTSLLQRGACSFLTWIVPNVQAHRVPSSNGGRVDIIFER